jgi:hypothetical protein
MEAAMLDVVFNRGWDWLSKNWEAHGMGIVAATCFALGAFAWNTWDGLKGTQNSLGVVRAQVADIGATTTVYDAIFDDVQERLGRTDEFQLDVATRLGALEARVQLLN